MSGGSVGPHDLWGMFISCSESMSGVSIGPYDLWWMFTICRTTSKAVFCSAARISAYQL